MSTGKAIYRACLGAAILAGSLVVSPALHAQGLAELGATSAIAGTLDSQQVGSGVGNIALDRARAAAAAQGQAGGGAAYNPTGNTIPAGPGGTPTFANPGAAPFGAGLLQQNIAPVNKSTYATVLSGTRVFDAVSKELLDDAQEIKVPDAEKAQFFDDGTHGDVAANDGQFTRVDERADVLGQSDQRVKERLVQALLSADRLTPVEFYGFNVMTTENRERSTRRHAWKLVPNTHGGPGLELAEVPVEEPVVVPNYRTWLGEKDIKVKDDWAKRFLESYRVDKDSLSSEFFSLYIPMPPVVPATPPPTGWTPYPDPDALNKYNQQQAQQQVQGLIAAGGLVTGLNGAPLFGAGLAGYTGVQYPTQFGGQVVGYAPGTTISGASFNTNPGVAGYPASSVGGVLPGNTNGITQQIRQTNGR